MKVKIMPRKQGERGGLRRKRSSVLMTLNVASATTLSYEQPFLLKERLMWKVLSVSSSSLFLNSFQQSVWKTYIFSRFIFTLENAFFQLCVITSLYNDFVLHNIKLYVKIIAAYPLLVLVVVVGGIGWGTYRIFQFYRSHFTDRLSAVVFALFLSLYWYSLGIISERLSNGIWLGYVC